MKLLLTSISKNQDLFENKIKELEEKLNNIDLSFPTQIPKENVERVEKTEKTPNIRDFKATRELQKSKTRREPIRQYDDLNRKMTEMEYKIKLLYNFIPKFPDDKTKTLNNILDEQQINIENNNTEIKEMKEKVDHVKETVDEIRLKMNDMDIYDIIKDIQF